MGLTDTIADSKCGSLDVEELREKLKARDYEGARRVMEAYELRGGPRRESVMRRGISNSHALSILKEIYSTPKQARKALTFFEDRGWMLWGDNGNWV